MATGILGTSALSAGANATVYTVPADTFAVITVNLANRNASARNVRIALAADDTSVQNAEYIEYDTEILGNGSLERGGIVVEAGRSVVAYANSTDVSVQVYGIETAVV